MSIFTTLATALALLLFVLMAVTPLLVELNDRFPVRRATSAAKPLATGRTAPGPA
ncbi:hypothetical protein [Amycolatopsis anabasis]|uniref:hypothetical protein n=1 Tax=Amycolatopsis anabasis TaxID=1840409 RepID=UPI00131BEC97|nr:hypothetical protein [Amycolatopsis anabasis]